tara:strand:+ start:1144 stop:1563 length:420 start_codon:yes stop_codon:yes gene_type:complete
MKIASLSSIHFDPAPAVMTLTVIADDVYNTPDGVKQTVGQISRQNYVDATLRGSVILSASDTCVLTIRLTDGATDFGSEQITLTAVDRYDFAIDAINLKRVGGATPLYVAVNVDTATAAATGQIYAQLQVEFPLVISNE